MELDLPQLDILIYAHDGRGLGHVGRSAAIGMAIRRLYPELKVCLVSGCSKTQDLIGEAPLDWLKLPAYRTEVVSGRSRGVDGLSGYSDPELGVIRAEQIRQMVLLYRPRLVLADHSPQGKHKELIPALKMSGMGTSTRWLLGIRGIVGNVKQTTSDLAKNVYRDFYSGLFWYGDSVVLGAGIKSALETRFNSEVHECGYVSRLSELAYIQTPETEKRYDCTISIPWLGEGTAVFLETLAAVFKTMASSFGQCIFFMGDGVPEKIVKTFEGLDRCRVEPFGSRYAQAINLSRSAVIFGGYNSIVDVLSKGIPALVVTRNMNDGEQQQHLDALCTASDLLSVVEEQGVGEEVLKEKLSLLLSESSINKTTQVDINGAENTAQLLASFLEQREEQDNDTTDS